MKLTYQEAGVDIHAADAFVARIGQLARATHTDGVVPHRSEYASLFKPNLQGMAQPLIAATCDGVGTKLLVARDMGVFRGLGQDLVGMNVNDLLPAAAKPLMFLDYIATGKLQADALVDVVAGMSDACKLAGCALLGGETAEMPGVYAPGDFDLAGFAVGIVDAANVPDLKSVQVGDQVLALPASGVHSNGFSLARKALFERGGLKLHDTPALLSASVGETLLIPTPIYVPDVLAVLAKVRIKAHAHVTGGGLLGRATRLLQDGQRLVLNTSRFDVPPIFQLIREAGDVAPDEMARTFNMGLGYLIVVHPKDVTTCLRVKGWKHVGEIVEGEKGVDLGRLGQ